MKDHDEFESLFRRYWKQLYSICYSKTQDVEASEEMVQDIFISLWKRWDQLEITASLESYLIKSAKLKVIDYYRKESKNNIIQFPKAQSSEKKTPETPIVAYNEAELNMLQDDTDHIISQLPAKCQAVYRLSRENQLTTKEIALQLGVSQKTVKNHLTKALSFIRSQMEDQ
ncbi:MAG: sigma-70 family RNA polymerase sigma factor [Bacteroidota bacterium]